MTSTEIIAIIGAVGVVLTQIVTAWRTDARVQVMKDNVERSAGVADKKLDKIHDLTNSNLTTVKTDLTLANDRIAKLESMIQEMTKGKFGEEEKVEMLEEVKKKNPKKE